MTWNDLIRGAVEIDTATLSDPVLIREDGRFLYTLPSVVDDIDFAITHIIRGEDHVTNTAVQIEIFEALGATRAGFRPSSAADRRGRRGAVEAAGFAVAAFAARGRHRADGGSTPISPRSAPPMRSSRARRWTSWSPVSRSKKSAARRRISMSAELSDAQRQTAACFCLSKRWRSGSRRSVSAAAPRSGTRCSPNLSALVRCRDLWALVDGPDRAGDRGRRA